MSNKNIWYYILNLGNMFRVLAAKGMIPMDDKKFLKKTFKYRFGYELDLDNPKTFNEKLQWLKLYDRKPIYTIMVDKYKAKSYVANLIGEKYIIPSLGVWKNFNDIDFDSLPNQFVLKCTHDSGGVFIVKDKSQINKNMMRKEISRNQRRNYFYLGREWPYKNVPPLIIAEKYMTEKAGGEIIDYKIHNFSGEPKVILVCKNRHQESGLTEDFYSIEWEHLALKRAGCANSEEEICTPEELPKLLELSRVLSKGFPFLRTDFYIIDHKVYFSELTLYPASGFEGFEPEKWDQIFGSWINLL